MTSNSVDRHIGNRVRFRRKILNMSQYSLSFELGISFQQLQKYESGENRISASRLYEISKVLGVTPFFFFAGLDGIITDDEMPKDLRTVRAFHVMNKIQNQKVKDQIINLIMELGI